MCIWPRCCGAYYVWGGFLSAELDDNDKYSIGGDSWTSKTDLPSPARTYPGGTAISGKGYCFGGYDSGGSTAILDNDEYTPGSDSWASKTDVPSPERSLAPACSASGYGFYFAGAESATHVDDNDRYDPSGNTWSTRAVVPSPLRRMHAVTAIGTLVYSWAGSYLTYQDDNDEYDNGGDSWTARTATPTALDAAAAASVGDVGYLIGGRWTGVPSTTPTDEYDPNTDTWTSMTDAAHYYEHPPLTLNLASSHFATAVAARGKVYYCAGTDSSGNLTNWHEVYDPGSDTWQARERMLTNRIQAAGGAP